MKKQSLLVMALSFYSAVTFSVNDVYEAGHQSLTKWLLPAVPPQPSNNKLNDARVELGKYLFFEPRLSGKGNMSCATCHNPSLGWSDGQATAVGHDGLVLERASPTIVNTGYNSIQMWDGRKKTLEEQALGPMEAPVEMASDMNALFEFLNSNQTYQKMFSKAYPGEGIDSTTLSRAIASFERSIISNSSPFDRWVGGEKTAMTKAQVQGFKVFVDPKKGNCAACHRGPNFTDNGFHNLGLASYSSKEPDLGRFKQRPLKLMRGAFKTPTLRDVIWTAPYFHDGSAKDLVAVIEHYVSGGVEKSNLSPNMKTLNLDKQEIAALISFIQALASPQKEMLLPILPQ